MQQIYAHAQSSDLNTHFICPDRTSNFGPAAVNAYVLNTKQCSSEVIEEMILIECNKNENMLCPYRYNDNDKNMMSGANRFTNKQNYRFLHIL